MNDKPDDLLARYHTGHPSATSRFAIDLRSIAYVECCIRIDPELAERVKDAVWTWLEVVHARVSGRYDYIEEISESHRGKLRRCWIIGDNPELDILLASPLQEIAKTRTLKPDKVVERLALHPALHTSHHKRLVLIRPFAAQRELFRRQPTAGLAAPERVRLAENEYCADTGTRIGSHLLQQLP